MNACNDSDGGTTVRSPQLMNRHDTALVVIDVQEKLVPHIHAHQKMIWNIGRLIDGAAALGVTIRATEQYPKGLGGTVSPLAERLSLVQNSMIPEKIMFSCRECRAAFGELVERRIQKLLLTGIETHVCVLQSALDLIAGGFNVYLCTDAVGSRYELDRDIAIRRMEDNGVTLTTTETALFEWCEQAGSPEFKTISQLAQQKFDDRR
jgi:nicotinamidase-related amidase